MDRGPLGDDIDRFIDDVADELAELSHQPAESHRSDVVLEAAAIVAATLDADGRVTDDEAWAFVHGIGLITEPGIIGTPAEIREMGVISGKARWVDAPSVLFDLLTRADARDGTVRCHRYHDLALRLSHACAAIDILTSPLELDLIERFRQTMLGAMDAAGTPAPRSTTGAAGTGRPSGDAQADRRLSGASDDAQTAVVPQGPMRPLTELQAELDTLVGLRRVKEEVARLTSLLQIQALRAERGLPVIETSHHLVFTGNPGTGKTTVARLLSEIYRAVGVVSKGHLIETDRSQLVAGFVGQTAAKTRAVLESALGGMLLIDEAYSLARGGEDDFGREAIDTLVKFMEDHRDDIGIVAAGYPAEMQDFIDTNPGLQSRFTRTVAFEDYTDGELVEIFVRLGEKSHYSPSDDAVTKLQALLVAQPRGRGFGNARFVRNVFEDAVARQAQRLSGLGDPTDEQLTTLVADDLPPVGAPL